MEVRTPQQKDFVGSINKTDPSALKIIRFKVPYRNFVLRKRAAAYSWFVRIQSNDGRTTFRDTVF